MRYLLSFVFVFAVSCVSAPTGSLVCNNGVCTNRDACEPERCLPDEAWDDHFCTCRLRDDAHLD